MRVFVLTVKQPLLREVYLCDSGRNVGRQGDVLKFYSCHSPPRSDSLPEVKAKADQMKHTFTLITIMDFYGFEHCLNILENTPLESYQVILLSRKLRLLK